MLQVENLTKKFGDLVAVDSLSLEIPKGELFGFLGPNGAGKTTTIKLMVGLLRPDSGRVTIDGIDIVEHPERAKSTLGYVPDEPELYPELKGVEFLQFIGDIYGVDTARQGKQMPKLLDLFDLTEDASRLIEGYSHGMRSKLAIASTLLHEPQILFLDEPTGGLDPQGARVMKDVLEGLVAKGKVVFMSTHILEVAEKLCTQVGIINEGKLIAEGNLEELRRKAQMQEDQNLEDIFLNLTGGEEYREVIKYLEG